MNKKIISANLFYPWHPCPSGQAGVFKIYGTLIKLIRRIFTDKLLSVYCIEKENKISANLFHPWHPCPSGQAACSKKWNTDQTDCTDFHRYFFMLMNNNSNQYNPPNPCHPCPSGQAGVFKIYGTLIKLIRRIFTDKLLSVYCIEKENKISANLFHPWHPCPSGQAGVFKKMEH